MIGHLRGSLLAVGAGWAVIDTGGIGWRVLVPSGIMDGYEGGDEVSLLIHTAVREDAITLYGFPDAQAMEVFHTLVGVQGMGPTLALSLLGTMPLPEMAAAIVSGDTKALCRAHGVGARIAARLVAELGKKQPFVDLGRVAAERQPADAALATMRAGAIRALTRLDISASAAASAVTQAIAENPGSSKLEDIVRLALPIASRG